MLEEDRPEARESGKFATNVVGRDKSTLLTEPLAVAGVGGDASFA